MTQVVERSEAGRMRSLALANEVRFARSRMKRAIGGTADAAALIRDTPWFARSMKATKFLLAVPGLGPAKIRTLLLRARVSDAKTLGGLSSRQREELAVLLETAGWRL